MGGLHKKKNEGSYFNTAAALGRQSNRSAAEEFVKFCPFFPKQLETLFNTNVSER